MGLNSFGSGTAFMLIVFAAGCAQVTSPPISVAVSPPATAIGTGQSIQFRATVANDTTGVTWMASTGTIDANGDYVSPSEARSVTATVTATSKKDPSKSASATTW